MVTTEGAAAVAAVVVTGSVDMVELLSAVLVVVDCIEEVDTAEDVSPSAFDSIVDEVTCCLGDNE